MQNVPAKPVIENWQVGECLGEGFCGAVFKAEHVKKKLSVKKFLLSFLAFL